MVTEAFSDGIERGSRLETQQPAEAPRDTGVTRREHAAAPPQTGSALG